MSKTKKIALFSGLAVLLIAVVIVLVVMLTRDNYLDGPKKNLIGFNGNVVEIISDNAVVVEITKRIDYDLNVGDKVTVNYTSATVHMYDAESGDYEGFTNGFELQVGDVVAVQYFEENLKTNGDKIEVDNGDGEVSIDVYLSDLENRTFYERAY